MDDLDISASRHLHTISVYQPRHTALPAEQLSHITVALHWNRTSSSIFGFCSLLWGWNLFLQSSYNKDWQSSKKISWEKTEEYTPLIPSFQAATFFTSKISYLTISVSSLTSPCPSWHVEITTPGSAQDMGTAEFSVGDKLHFVLLSLSYSSWSCFIFGEGGLNCHGTWNQWFQKCQWQLWDQNFKFQVQHHAAII